MIPYIYIYIKAPPAFVSVEKYVQVYSFLSLSWNFSLINLDFEIEMISKSAFA